MVVATQGQAVTPNDQPPDAVIRGECAPAQPDLATNRFVLWIRLVNRGWQIRMVPVAENTLLAGEVAFPEGRAELVGGSIMLRATPVTYQGQRYDFFSAITMVEGRPSRASINFGPLERVISVECSLDMRVRPGAMQ
jgi:hypothetical protein